MNSPAIKLARECGLPSADIEALQEHQPEFLKTFYTKAQAQALHQWAKEAEGYTNPLKLANDMDAAADELERKA